jgi:hydroxypyruvate isomerase
MHLMSGIAEDGPETRATWLANLRWAAEQAPAGLTLTVEPINRRDMPGYFLHRQAQALELLATLGSPRVKLQLDLYHCRVSEGGESLGHLRRALDLGLLGHVQLAGVDGRHEPLADEYAAELALLAERAWPGSVGLEYRPRGDTSAGLAWLSPASG